MKKRIDVHGIAALAKLSLDADEATRLETEMGQFSDYARILEEYIDSEDTVRSTSAKLDEMREDRTRENSMNIESFATGVSDGYFRVPLTVEGE